MIASFLEIEYDVHEDLAGHWMPAGGSGWEDKVKQDVTVDYLGVELQGLDVDALAQHWSTVTGLPMTTDDGAPSIELNNVSIRFVEAEDGRGAGLGGLDIAVHDRNHILDTAKQRGCYVDDNRVDICGTRWYLYDA